MTDILARHLRVDVEDYRDALRRSDDLIVSRLDTRVTAPIPKEESRRSPAANDPALGLGASNMIVSKPIGDYMRNELHVPTSRDYVSLTLNVYFQWTWPAVAGPDAAPDLAAGIATFMNARPEARLLLVGGYYDLVVPLLAPRYALEHAWLPMDRVRMVAMDSGHSTFDGEKGRRDMKLLLTNLIDKK